MELTRTRDNASFVIFEFIFKDRNKFRHMLHIFEDLTAALERRILFIFVYRYTDCIFSIRVAFVQA